MKYFNFKEFEKTSYNVNNSIPNETVKNNIELLVNKILDPIREKWGKPVIVTSGYRCPKLNDFVGGSQNSEHLTGQAADISVGSPEMNKKLFELILKSGLVFNQLIDEYNYLWIHVSYNKEKNNMQVLHKL